MIHILNSSSSATCAARFGLGRTLAARPCRCERNFCFSYHLCTNAVDQVETYAWQKNIPTKNSGPSPRMAHAACTGKCSSDLTLLSNRIPLLVMPFQMWIIGGYDGITELSDIWSYDTKTHLWTERKVSSDKRVPQPCALIRFVAQRQYSSAVVPQRDMHQRVYLHFWWLFTRAVLERAFHHRSRSDMLCNTYYEVRAHSALITSQQQADAVRRQR